MNFTAKIVDHQSEVMAKINADTIEKLGKAAMMVRNTAKQEVPVKTGALKKSIRIKIDRKEKSAKIIAGNKKAWYVHLVEYGSNRERYWKGNGPKRRGKRSTGVMPKNDFLNRSLEKNLAAMKELFAKPIPDRDTK